MKALLALALAVTAPGPAMSATPAQGTAAATPTIVNDGAALRRLQRNSGITLQWISFESPARGHVIVRERDGLYTLSGLQVSQADAGLVTIHGDILSIESDRFMFRGRIEIRHAPDPDRRCIRDGVFEFRVTQNRRYWRLQQMQACDGLTDYVDIYF